jgi:hypothetical protein
VQGLKKIAQIWNVQFRFVPLHTLVISAHLALVQCSWVHSSGVHGPVADKAVKDLRNVTRTYIYCVYIK